jgi:Fe-Mn family superoxide dismutase
MDKYVLPQLTFDYSALEPHISGRIMELHHQSTTAATSPTPTPRSKSWPKRGERGLHRDRPLERALAFNVSGHVLHSTFWQNLGPKMGGEPGGELAEQIRRTSARSRSSRSR